MKCPFCNYNFYTLRNVDIQDTKVTATDPHDPGRTARKLWLNCPDCLEWFPTWAHFDYNPETSEAFSYVADETPRFS